MKKSIDALINGQNEQLNKLHEIVLETLKQEKLIIHNLQNPPQEMLSKGQRISDKVASFGGSWYFIITFGLMILVWVLLNILLPIQYKFDAYPFIFLNLILSCVAAIQAPVIMMSQNRKEEKDRMRSENDYMINLKAELEVRSLHQKMDLLLEEQIKTLYDSQEKQYSMLKKISKQLNSLTNN